MAYVRPIENFCLGLANKHQRSQQREELSEEDYEQAQLDVPATLTTIEVRILFLVVCFTLVLLEY